MRESRPYGSVRGARSNARPYRDCERREEGRLGGFAGRRSRKPAQKARFFWRGGGIGVLVTAKGHGKIPDRQKSYIKIRKNTIICRARIASHRACRVTAHMGGTRTLMRLILAPRNRLMLLKSTLVAKILNYARGEYRKDNIVWLRRLLRPPIRETA